MKKDNYLLCLDFLRGLAAVIVMFYHFSSTPINPPLKISYEKIFNIE